MQQPTIQRNWILIHVHRSNTLPIFEKGSSLETFVKCHSLRDAFSIYFLISMQRNVILIDNGVCGADLT